MPMAKGKYLGTERGIPFSHWKAPDFEHGIPWMLLPTGFMENEYAATESAGTATTPNSAEIGILQKVPKQRMPMAPSQRPSEMTGRRRKTEEE